MMLMRDLLHRLGCLVQLALGVVCFLGLRQATQLPLWAVAALALPASMIGTLGLMAVAGLLLDRS